MKEITSHDWRYKKFAWNLILFGIFGEEGLPQSSFSATTGKTWPHVASIYSLTLFFPSFKGPVYQSHHVCVCFHVWSFFWRYANYASQQPCHILRKISLLPSTSVLTSQHQHLTETFFFGGKKWSLELALIFAGVDALGEVGEDVEGTGLDSWQSQRSSSCPQRTPAPERWGPGIMDWVWGWPPFFNRYIDGNFLSEVHWKKNGV